MPEFNAAGFNTRKHSSVLATDIVVANVNLFEDLKVSQRVNRGRRILSHAIEHLTGSMADIRESPAERDARLQAVQILMALNREVYLEGRSVPTFGERCLTWLRNRAI